MPTQCSHSTVAEKQLAVRLIRARKAGSLSSEQEAAIVELERTAIKELLANGGVSKASRKLLELEREGNKKAREAADRVSTEYERLHIDIDEDPLGLPFLGHAGHARGEEAMRQIEEAMRRKGKHRMDDAQKERSPSSSATGSSPSR